MQWLMLQQSEPKDFVIATGRQHSVRDFLTWAFNHIGVEVEFEGAGIKERCLAKSVDKDIAPRVKVGQILVEVDERYFRPTEVDSLLGDPSLARSELNWTPKISTKQLCEEMVLADYESLKDKNNA
jgi:GDPmannose 4,6-dehydratase